MIVINFSLKSQILQSTLCYRYISNPTEVLAKLKVKGETIPKAHGKIIAGDPQELVMLNLKRNIIKIYIDVVAHFYFIKPEQRQIYSCHSQIDSTEVREVGNEAPPCGQPCPEGLGCPEGQTCLLNKVKCHMTCVGVKIPQGKLRNILSSSKFLIHFSIQCSINNQC